MSTVWLEQRERGNLAAVRLMTWVTRALGRRVGRALLLPICCYFVAFAPGARRASRDFLGRVLGRPARIGEVFLHFHVFAATLLDRVEMLSRGSARFDIRVHGWPEMEATLARGQGCLLIGSHLGSAEILRAFGERKQKLAINLVMHEGNAQATSRWLRQMAPELAARIIAPGEAGTLLRVRECLARAGVDPALLSEVVVGCVGPPHDQANVARVIALRAGLPQSVPAVTVAASTSIRSPSWNSLAAVMLVPLCFAPCASAVAWVMTPPVTSVPPISRFTSCVQSASVLAASARRPSGRSHTKSVRAGRTPSNCTVYETHVASPCASSAGGGLPPGSASASGRRWHRPPTARRLTFPDATSPILTP